MVYVVELILFYIFLDLKVKCMLISSPCMETQYWNNYRLQCFQNHSIYITHHIGKDVVQQWTPPENTSGCQEMISNSCSFSLPLEEMIRKYSSPFASAVNQCNNKRECTLPADYFGKIDSDLRSLCKDSLNISFRQSIEYECIPDAHVVRNCSGVTDNISKHIYLQLFDGFSDQPCHVYADLSKVKILQTYQTELRISSNGILIYEHLASNVALYGVDIPLFTNHLIIDMRERSTNTYIMMKLEVKKSSKIVFEVGGSHGSIKIVEKETHTSALIWIPTIFTVMLILLVLFSICQQRMQHSRSAVIDMADTGGKLVFRLETKRKGNGIKIEMHKAECLCEPPQSRSTREISYPLYIPSKHVSTVNNTINSEQDLSDAESETYIDMLSRN